MLGNQTALNSTVNHAIPVQPLREQKPQLIRQLQARIRSAETQQRIDAGKTISSGCPAIDRLLPGGGYIPGTITQWLTPGGLGADYLSLMVAKEACRDGGALVVIDPWGQFYPPTAAALGINMGNLIILRSRQGRAESQDNDLFWSIDQSLRCPAVGAVWGPLDAIDERWFRRFQLSAESSGCLGLFVQNTDQARQPSWAEVQWLVTENATPTAGTLDAKEKPNSTSQPSPNQHHVRLQLTRCRGAQTGKSIDVAIDAVTGAIANATGLIANATGAIQ